MHELLGPICQNRLEKASADGPRGTGQDESNDDPIVEGDDNGEPQSYDELSDDTEDDSDSDQAFIEVEDYRKERRLEQRRHLVHDAQVKVAEREWRTKLRKLAKTKEIVFDYNVSSVLAIKLEGLDILLDDLMRHRVERVIFNLSQFFPGELVDLQRRARDFLDACIVQIGSKLGQAQNLSYLSFRNVPVTVISSVVASCRQNKTLHIVFKRSDFRADFLNLAESIGAHLSLEELTIVRFLHNMLPICLNIRAMTGLRKLKLSGTLGCPILVVSQADAEMVAAMTESVTLKQIEFDNMKFANITAADHFCRALTTSGLDQLKLGEKVQFPTESHGDLAKAVVSSKLTQFDFDAIVSQEFLSTFRTALTESAAPVLEQLSFNSQSGSLDSYCCGRDGSNRLLEQLNPDWLDSVKRILVLNHQRRTCKPLFAAIAEASDERTRRLRAAEAFTAVDMPVVYEYLHRNDCNLRGLIQQLAREDEVVTEATSGPPYPPGIKVTIK